MKRLLLSSAPVLALAAVGGYADTAAADTGSAAPPAGPGLTPGGRPPGQPPGPWGHLHDAFSLFAHLQSASADAPNPGTISH